MVYAGFWRRFAAMLIDGLILLIPWTILNMVVPFVGAIVVAAFYYPFFDASELRGTPGRVFMGLAVTMEDGERVPFKQALIRFFLAIVSGMFMGLGYLFNLFTPKRQTFHDIMAGTVVVRRAETVAPDWVGAWLREFKTVFNIRDVGPTPVEGPKADSASAMSTLESLHKLFNQGAISEAEYNAKKEEILKRI